MVHRNAKPDNTQKWVTPAVVAAGGVAVLCFALMRSLTPAPEPTADLEKEISQLRQSVEQADAQLAKTVSDGRARDAELVARKSELKALETRIASRTEQVKKLEELNRKRIAEMREGIEATRKATAGEVADANKALRLQAIKEEDQRRLEANLNTARQALLTVVTSRGGLTLGFFINGFRVPVGVTISAEGDLPALIKMRYMPQGSPNFLTAIGRPKVLHRDPETGVTVFSIAFNGTVTINTFNRPVVLDLKPGDRLYSLCNQIIGDKILEQNVFDGTVSAAGRKIGDLSLVQTTLSANEGSMGSPVISADGRLCGMLLGSVEGLEKTSLVLPAQGILNVLRKVQVQP